MEKREQRVAVERCILGGEEYLRTPPEGFNHSFLDALSNDDLKLILPVALKENGRTLYEWDKDRREGVFYLESQKAQERLWRAISWRLIACTIPLQVVDEDEVLKFCDLIVSEEAEGGTIIAKGFTASAIKAAEKTRVELMDEGRLAGLLTASSSPSPYCPSCLQIPQGIRESLLRLKHTVKSMRDSSNKATAKWTSPLQAEMLIREMVVRASSLFGGKNPSSAFEAELREEIDALCNDLENAAKRIERLDELLAIPPVPHGRTET
jgi:hypothetical protein